jgi:hypothetical protein
MLRELSRSALSEEPHETRLLQGLRILDLTSVYATQIFGDFGAWSALQWL